MRRPREVFRLDMSKRVSIILIRHRRETFLALKGSGFNILFKE